MCVCVCGHSKTVMNRNSVFPLSLTVYTTHDNLNRTKHNIFEYDNTQLCRDGENTGKCTHVLHVRVQEHTHKSKENRGQHVKHSQAEPLH